MYPDTERGAHTHRYREVQRDIYKDKGIQINIDRERQMHRHRDMDTDTEREVRETDKE